MSMTDIFQNMHPKVQHRFTDILLTAAIIHKAGQADWRDYVRMGRNRSIGRLRKTLQTVLDYTDEQFESFVSKI
jgi:hypothetical protein